MQFDPDDSLIHYVWTLDRRRIASDTLLVEVTFADTGRHVVACAAVKGEEIDRVEWTVDVLNREGITEEAPSLIPATPTLYPPFPNPFNSVAAVRYYLPRPAIVNLSLYDLSGRRLAELFGGRSPAGLSEVNLDLSARPAGMYLLRLSGDRFVLTRKAVLMK
jgi:hypothetical protein